MKHRSLLVVGAGFAGATYARIAAEAGYNVTVIDKRDHIGGNAFDYTDSNDVRVHRYGPHLFHTNNGVVVDWLRQFGVWVPYEHRVKARLPSGEMAPLPINRKTLEIVFSQRLSTEEDARALLQRVAVPIADPKNAAEYLYSAIGRDLTELFFRPYTEKMWAMRLEEVATGVVKRIPLRTDDEDRYFPGDKFQIMPRDGYTRLFERIFDHPRIEVHTNTAFRKEHEAEYQACFLSLPIDEYFDFAHGELPYRSIIFESRSEMRQQLITWAVTNFTDHGPHTRETHWHVLPHHDGGGASVTVTKERPCDYRENNGERYYPVRTSDNRHQRTYEMYKADAQRLPHVQFIGRCGTYQYLDMHQVINQSMLGARRWLDSVA